MKDSCSEHCSERHEQNTWSKVFSRPTGRFLILSGFICLVLFIAMLVQTYTYIQQVMDDTNIMCISSSAHDWAILSPLIFANGAVMLFTFFASFSCRIQLGRYFMCFYIVLLLLYIPMLLIMASISSLSNESGMVIRHENSSIMYQYMFTNHQVYAYPIVPDIDDINVTDLNMTCDSMKTSDICRGRDRILRANFSEIFLCHHSNDEGLHYITSYLELFSSRANSAANLYIAFLIFFLPTFIIVLFRRFVPEHYWCENKLCESHGTSERTPLLLV